MRTGLRGSCQHNWLGTHWHLLTRGLPAWQLLGGFIFAFPKIPDFEKISQVEQWGAKKHFDFFSLLLLLRPSWIQKMFMQVLLKLWLFYLRTWLTNQRVLPLKSWAHITGAQRTWEWAQGSEGSAHEESCSYFSCGSPSATCLSSNLQRKGHGKMTELQQSMLTVWTALRARNSLAKSRLFFVWNLLFNRPSPLSSKAGMCLRTFWQQALHIIL